MSDLDPDRFTLRQAAQARDDFAQIMDELEFLKAQLAGLPTRRDQAFVPLKIMFGSAVMGAALAFFGWKRPAVRAVNKPSPSAPNRAVAALERSAASRNASFGAGSRHTSARWSS